MKKYWSVFKINWQNSLEYRVEFFAHMVRGLINLAVLILIWGAVFKQVNNFGGYTFSSMVTLRRAWKSCTATMILTPRIPEVFSFAFR